MKAHLALAAAASIWGLSYLFTKIALRDMGPFELAAIRTALAAAFFVPALLRARGTIGVRDGIVLGGLGITLYYAGFNVGLQEARATDAGVIQAAIPAATALVAIPMLGERGALWSWLGIALSTAGVILLVTGTSATGSGSLVGNLWIVFSVAVWALYSVIARRMARRASSTAITAATLVYGAALSVPFAALELATIVPRATPDGAAAVLFLAIFAGAIGYWLWAYGLSRVEAGRASAYLNLLPLVAVISGTLVLGEAVGALELAAGAIIISGVALAGRR